MSTWQTVNIVVRLLVLVLPVILYTTHVYSATVNSLYSSPSMTTPVTIRPLREEDLELVLEWTSAEGWHVSRNILLACYRCDPCGWLAAERDDRFIGQSSLECWEYHYSMLNWCDALLVSKRNDASPYVLILRLLRLVAPNINLRFSNLRFIIIAQYWWKFVIKA